MGTDPAAFALAINSATGELYVAQYLSLEHPTPGASHDEVVELSKTAITVTVTITDHDGDSATSAAVAIGHLVAFSDDGPTIGGATNNAVDEDDLTGAGHPGNSDVAAG